MLAPSKELDWKFDIEKKNEKFIFRTIDLSSPGSNTHKFNKIGLLKQTRRKKKIEREKDEIHSESENKIKSESVSKAKKPPRRERNILYELISVTEELVLLQKKKQRYVINLLKVE